MLHPDNPGVPSPPDLSSANAMDGESRNLLFASIQRELHAIARRNMAHQPLAHTLQPTALVNEAYLRLHAHPEVFGMPPGEFLRLAAKVMQNLLVNHAREKQTKKRTAPGERVPLDSVVESFSERALDILALKELSNSCRRPTPRRRLWCNFASSPASNWQNAAASWAFPSAPSIAAGRRPARSSAT